MERVFFKPWIGEEYKKTGLLVLGESAYGWRDEHGDIVEPSSDHPTGVVRCWGIEHFGKRGYHTAMSRALSGKEAPTLKERENAWKRVAFTEFIQSTVGVGAGRAPTSKQIDVARELFLPFLETFRPLKVLITGKRMWNDYLPGCNGPHICDDLQAYRLADGTLVWCLAVPHPANRQKGVGFPWARIGESIRVFVATSFPTRG
ncbi:MAG: hypothetical protein ABR928_05775 [Terracidiphilus sp.]|jgi:hypothetical protein